MQKLALFSAALALVLAALLSYLAAGLITDYFERRTVAEMRAGLDAEGFDWVSLRADGLRLHVSGPAPSESARFNALALLKQNVRADWLEDDITVVDPNDLKPPQFSLELLRRGEAISLIGLIPEATGRAEVLATVSAIEGAGVTDMLDTADHPVPEGWQAALAFALDSLAKLPASKISVVPGRVTITAITGSPEEKRRTEQALQEARPEGLELVLHIRAPRPVIAPFSLRMIIDGNGARFDSCSADSEAARARILSAARRAGLKGEVICTIGLGTPTPRWGEAAELAIGALAELGGGSLTFSDADITLIAREGTEQIDFDRIVYNFEQALPDVFSVQAVLPPKPVLEGEGAAAETPQFLATLSPEGLVQMRGRMRDERSRTSAANFARAAFGGDNVHDTTRIEPTLPEGWSVRVLAGLQALEMLHHGILTVEPDRLELRGVSNRPDTATRITQLLSEALGETARFSIDITYEEVLDKQAQLPSPQECVDSINAILAEQQITFAPSSSKIDEGAMKVVERIAKVMRNCQGVKMEIGGHTDSQGRESMNLTLSQARAEAVLDALLSLEVLTTNLSARGYGESQPIADNKTEEGRRANRRIAFRLIEGPDEEPEKTGDTADAADDPEHKDTPPKQGEE